MFFGLGNIVGPTFGGVLYQVKIFEGVHEKWSHFVDPGKQNMATF